MPYDLQSLDDLLSQGATGLLTALLVSLAFAAIWAIKEGKVKAVVFKFGDRGFAEIFGYRLPWLIRGATWFYVEGIFTQSKISVRKQTIRIVRRDKVDNEIVITLIDLVIHVIDTEEKIRAAIYDFMDLEFTGGLSDGFNVEFRRYVEMQTCSSAMTLVEKNVIASRANLVEHFERLCGAALDNVGVKIDEVFVIEHAPPNEYATAGALGRFMGVPLETPDIR